MKRRYLDIRISKTYNNTLLDSEYSGNFKPNHLLNHITTYTANTMKHQLLPPRLLLLALLSLMTSFMAEANISDTNSIIDLDRIVAVANDEIILESELDEFLHTVKQQLRERNTPLPTDDAIRKQALDRLIINRLQLQIASRNGIRVDDESLNEAINRIAKQNKMQLDQFRETLKREGFDYIQFRENIRNEMIIGRLQQRTVASRIRISDQEIEDFLVRQKQLGASKSQYKYAHILIALPDAASPEKIKEVREKALKVLADLQNGTDFRQTAVSVSDGQKALEGGEQDWLSPGQIPSLFTENILSMQRGEISGLIRSPSGFHIIQLIDIKGEPKHVVKQTLVRHILLRTSELVSNMDARTHLSQLKERIEGGEDFATIARAHSQDTLSAKEGGSLGWVSPGDMVPQFEKAMNQHNKNEISKSFRTQFGWHILQVLDRKEYDDTKKFLHSKAKEYIRARKSQEALELWIRRLRDEAYVEYRLEDNL